MTGRTGSGWRVGALVVVGLLQPCARADEPAGPAEVDAAVQRITTARTQKDAKAAEEAVAPVAELVARVPDPKQRARLLNAAGSILREPGVAGAHRATVRELLSVDDPAAYTQVRPHLPVPKDPALKPLGAEVLSAIGDHPVVAALPQLKDLVSRAEAVEVREAALQALGGYGRSSARVGVLEFLLDLVVGMRLVPGSRPRWDWVNERQREVPGLVSALQRLTGRADGDLLTWASQRGAGALASRFDPAVPLALPPTRSSTPWQRARVALGTPPASVKGPVDRALAWLAAHQAPDGSFGAASFAQWCNGAAVDGDGPSGPGNPAYDVGVTGLALNAFLVAGYTSSGTHAYDVVVARALRWLAAQQDAEGVFGRREVRGARQLDGPGAGRLPPGPGAGAPPARARPADPRSVDGVFVYNQALATLALVEAYGLTGDAATKSRAQKGLAWIESARNPYFGWRYGHRPGENDTSVTVWMTQALCCAKLVNAAHLLDLEPVPFSLDEEAFAGTRAWLDKMTDPDSGRVGYRSRGYPSSRVEGLEYTFPEDYTEALTAAGIHTLLLMGEDVRKRKPVAKGVALCMAQRPSQDSLRGRDLVYWHFGSLALHRIGGNSWELWMKDLHRALLGSQCRDGVLCGELGSWDPYDPWGGEGGRVYATAINVLTLLTPWRFPAWGM